MNRVGSRLTRSGQWLVRNPIAALTVVGAVTYGLVRLAYSLFYSQLGLTPEDVGLGYQELLAQSAVSLIVLLVIGFVLSLLAALAVAAYAVFYLIWYVALFQGMLTLDERLVRRFHFGFFGRQSGRD